jgi:tryptophan 2,3-dioxygenase
VPVTKLLSAGYAAVGCPVSGGADLIRPPGTIGYAAGGTDYADLLRLDELLTLQWQPPAHDATMFVVIHQAHELWFKLMVHELTDVRDRLLAAELDRAGHLLGRIAVVQTLLIQHWGVLDTMLPEDFLAFRDGLQGGSGFESAQYREIEFVAGLKDRSYLARARLSDADSRRLRRRLDEPSVWDAFEYLVADHGLESMAAIYRRGGQAGGTGEFDWGLLRIAERLLDFDAALAQWRARHTLVVERLIGHKPGTGGSSGVGYLRSRLHIRLFPELWEARSQL